MSHEQQSSQDPAPQRKKEDSELAQISVKMQIPDFWTDQPRLWFGQFEAIVANQKQGERSKFNLVVGKLTKDNVQQVADLILHPPEEKAYTILKERLLTVYEESESSKIQKLLTEIELGEQKPSHMLRKMQDLAQDKFPEDTLRILWIGHLPASVRAVLTVSEIADINKLAQMADKVMEIVKPDVSIAAVTTTISASNNDLIIAEIAKLRDSIEEIQRGRPTWRQQHGARQRSQSRNRRYNVSEQRRNSQIPDWACYYHFRFGDKANKCVQPCNWKKEKSSSSAQTSGN